MLISKTIFVSKFSLWSSSFIDHQPTSQWQRRPQCNKSTISFYLWFWFWSNLPDNSNEVQPVTVERDDRHTPCANSTALERLLHLHSKNTCHRRTMLKICLHWRQDDFLQTRVSQLTLEMHIWPYAGLRERSNRVNIHFTARDARRLPNRCARSVTSARLNTQARRQTKFKIILTRQNSICISAIDNGDPLRDSSTAKNTPSTQL